MGLRNDCVLVPLTPLGYMSLTIPTKEMHMDMPAVSFCCDRHGAEQSSVVLPYIHNGCVGTNC